MNFDDWGTPPRQPRRSRRRATGRSAIAYFAGTIAVVLVIGLVVAGHEFLARPAVRVRPARTAPNYLIKPPSSLSLGACIDPTTSIVKSFAPAIRSELAHGVAALAPPRRALATGSKSLPRRGLDLTIRQVDTNSLSTIPGPYGRHVTLPAVPGLLRRPDPSIPNYGRALRSWSPAYQRVKATRAADGRAAERAVHAIATLPLDQNPQQNSGIIACISALLATVPTTGVHSYLLASDLQQNVAPQLAGSFDGAPLVIVQTCDTGNQSFCASLLQQFRSYLRSLHVGRVTVIRPEDAATAIRQWISTGEVPR